jgi:hypothetical protein
MGVSGQPHALTFFLQRFMRRVLLACVLIVFVGLVAQAFRAEWLVIETSRSWVIAVHTMFNVSYYPVAANMLNKQSRTADKEGFCSLGFGRGANDSAP